MSYSSVICRQGITSLYGYIIYSVICTKHLYILFVFVLLNGNTVSEYKMKKKKNSILDYSTSCCKGKLPESHNLFLTASEYRVYWKRNILFFSKLNRSNYKIQYYIHPCLFCVSSINILFRVSNYRSFWTG